MPIMEIDKITVQLKALYFRIIASPMWFFAWFWYMYNYNLKNWAVLCFVFSTFLLVFSPNSSFCFMYLKQVLKFSFWIIFQKQLPGINHVIEIIKETFILRNFVIIALLLCKLQNCLDVALYLSQDYCLIYKWWLCWFWESCCIAQLWIRDGVS